MAVLVFILNSFFVTLLFLFPFSSSMCTDMKDCFSKVKPGTLIGHNIKTLYNKGYSGCFNECFRHSAICASFNYHKITGLCELNSATPAPISLTQDPTSVNSLIPSVLPTNDPCLTNPCPPYHMCVALSSGATHCVTECDTDISPWDLETATVIERYHKAGEQLLYNCDTAYTQVNNRTCLADGTWNITQPLCVIKCDFEQPCPYLEGEGDLQFKQGKGSTPSKMTGCSTDHTEGGKYYYYLDASSTSTSSDKYKMITTHEFSCDRQLCVELWYHMHGADMGQLKVKIKGSDFTSTEIVASGPVGNNWNYKKIVFPGPFKNAWVIIVGERGTGTKSDICIDDVMIYEC